MRHKKAQKRQILPDRIYNNVLVTRLINRIMRDGKKSVAEKLVYNTLNEVKAQGHDPIAILHKAVTAVAPKVEIKARRVGGANYQVPVEVPAHRKDALAIRWILEAAAARSSKEHRTFDKKLFAEIMDATQEKGAAITKRNNTLRQAEANKAFAHFRW